MALDHTPRTAIIGAGLMGKWHSRYASRCGAKVVAVVDPDLSRAQELATDLSGASAYSSFEECLRQCELDVAHVCAPTDHHFDLCSRTLRAGLHTLVEKPAAADADLTAQLLTLSHDQNCRFGVSLQLRFQDGFRQLVEQRESLGDPVRIEFRAATAGGEGLDAAGRRELLWEILPHPLSVFAGLFCFQAWEANWNVDRADDQELELSTNITGVRCAILLSLRERPRALRLDWRGTAGRAEVDFYHGFAAVHRGTNTRADKLGRPFIEAAVDLQQAGNNLARRTLKREPAYPGLSALIDQFYASLRGESPPFSGAEILGIARTADTIREKAKALRP